MPGKLSVIFVAGAWHSEFHLQPIIPHLEQYNYRVRPVKLCTSSKHDPKPTRQDDIALIRAILQSELDAGYDICLIGHSVAGQACALAMNDCLSAASAAQKLQLKQVIFIACFFDGARLSRTEDWFTADEAYWATVNDPKHKFYNDMSQEEAQPFIDALEDHIMQPRLKSIPNHWCTEVKATYVICLQDNTVYPNIQRMEAEEMGITSVELDAGHCPSVSRPKELAETIHGCLSTSD